MSKTPFDIHFKEYEQWYEEHPFEYQSELQALRQAIGDFDNGLEIGIGTGRFALPLGISKGIDPSKEMLEIAKQKGLETKKAFAEKLPFKDHSHDLVLMVTTVCFLSDVAKAFSETHRILKPKGSLVIGFVDKTSPLGELYEAKKETSLFYKEAKFHSTEEMIKKLKKAGFPSIFSWQTLFNTQPTRVEPTIMGHGRGSFIVLKATKE